MKEIEAEGFPVLYEAKWIDRDGEAWHFEVMGYPDGPGACLTRRFDPDSDAGLALDFPGDRAFLSELALNIGGALKALPDPDSAQ